MSISPAEIEFLAEEEIVKVTPRFSLGRSELICGDFGNGYLFCSKVKRVTKIDSQRKTFQSRCANQDPSLARDKLTSTWSLYIACSGMAYDRYIQFSFIN